MVGIPASDPVHRLVTAHKQRFRRRLLEVAREAGLPDAERLALQLAVLYDGVETQALVGGDSEAAAAAARAAAAMLIGAETD
jgi:hypothetical protein